MLKFLGLTNVLQGKAASPFRISLPTQTTCTFFILTTTYIRTMDVTNVNSKPGIANCFIDTTYENMLCERRDCAVSKIIIILPVILNLPN